MQELESMTVAQLRRYALDNGMSTITKLGTKASLIRAITRYLTRANGAGK